MLDRERALKVLREAELLCPADRVEAALQRLAGEITATLQDTNPLVLSVMGGAVVFTGSLLPRLNFPLEFDYVHVTRYRGATRGADVQWRSKPHKDVRGRTVLVLDDILDEGNTLAAIRAQLLQDGAKAFHAAVMVDKDLGREKPIAADFVGLKMPNRYLFGFGMDVNEAWRNLPAIYALKD
jgi:hypoxanthine phosphoribosyltransferase